MKSYHKTSLRADVRWSHQNPSRRIALLFAARACDTKVSLFAGYHKTCSQQRNSALGDSFLLATVAHGFMLGSNNSLFIRKRILNILNNNSCVPETFRSLCLSNKHASNL